MGGINRKQMDLSVTELVTRVIKYLLEGLAVAIAMVIIPRKIPTLEEIVSVALVAAVVFAILDLLSVSNNYRNSTRIWVYHSIYPQVRCALDTFDCRLQALWVTQVGPVITYPVCQAITLGSINADRLAQSLADQFKLPCGHIRVTEIELHGGILHNVSWRQLLLDHLQIC